MKNHIKATLLVAAFMAASLGARANSIIQVPEGGSINEVYVLSMQFEGNGAATIVGRPCDPGIGCKNILARISKKTVWYNEDDIISYKQAKQLDWEDAILVIDKFNNALAVELIAP